MQVKIIAAAPGFGLWLLLVLIYFLYLPGQQGSFHFDDEINLRGLTQVQAGGSALTFSFSGEAGALARPVALASFLLNLGDWPINPQGFLAVNILLHLLNGALLAWLGLRLLRLAHPNLGPRAAWIAVSSAGLWLLMPLLASTSLIIIQRMASLSATFVLGGLLIYLVGLSWEAAGRITKGRWLQVTGIGFGTLLATLSKENGALLPLYALILESTVLSGVVGLARWRHRRMWLLALAPLALLAYLVTHISSASFAARDFTLLERLYTQPIILWDYLRLAFFPRSSAFLPFHDDYPIAQGLLDPPIAFIAILAWLILLGLALWQRKRWPWFALAVFWYLGGHLLESSALPLELYYEHRNYVPLMGPVLALAWLAWSLTGTWLRIAPALLGVYALMLAFVLWQTTSLWGQQLLAGEIWAIEHPHSPRAQQFLSQRYVLIGEQNTAYKVLSRAADQNPQRVDLALQALQLSCEAGREPEVIKDKERVFSRIHDASFSNAALNSLSTLFELHEQEKCQSFKSDDLHRFLDLLLLNPKYQAGYSLSYLHHIKSRLYRAERSLSGTADHLEKAFEAHPNIETAVMMIGTLISAGLHDEALDFIDIAREQAPFNPLLRSRWNDLLGQLQEQIQNMAKVAQ